MDRAKTTRNAPPTFTNEALCTLPDPISLLEEEHELQRELCHVLETLADDLPSSFDKDLASVAVAILDGSLERHMKLEEEGLFPLLRECVSETDPIHSALRCLEEEHERDSVSHFEITEALRTAIEKNRVENANMLGYMLRGFFECLRRHVAWEERVLIPAARSALSVKELSRLQSWIMSSEHPRCCHTSLVLIHKAQTAREICKRCPKGVSPSNIVSFQSKSDATVS